MHALDVSVVRLLCFAQFCSLPSAIAMTIIGVPADRQPTQLRRRSSSALLVHDVTSAQLSDTNAT